jgi:hypothetical protein
MNRFGLAFILFSATFGMGCDSGKENHADAAGQGSPDVTTTPSKNDGAAAGIDGGPPYANVTAVTATGTAGSYTLSVSVESVDIDCTQFANFWEVLSPDGTLIYRRILEHCHTDENGTTDTDAPGNTFTRTGGPVAIAADQLVIVRAHMSNGGYNGQAMQGTVEAGFTAAADIGRDFAPGVETAEPQPTGCLF